MRSLKNLDRRKIKELALGLAKKFRNKDAVIGLIGPLGSGKTTFTKEFAKRFGIKKAKSPTFIVAAEYELKDRKFYHIDLYRLSRLDELQTIGLNDILLSKGRIVVIEWADKFPAIKKRCDAILEFAVAGKDLRHVKIQYN